MSEAWTLLRTIADSCRGVRAEHLDGVPLIQLIQMRYVREAGDYIRLTYDGFMALQLHG